MTGEELKEIQRAAGASDREFLLRLGLSRTETARRRLRRWKLGGEPVPDHIAELARGLLDRNT